MIPTWPTKIQLKYSACSRYKIACYCLVKEGRPTQIVAEGESRFREFVPAFQFMVPLAPTSSKIEAHLTKHKLHWNYVKGIAKQMFQKEALEFCTENELWRIVAALEYKAKRATNETRRIPGQTT